MGKQNDNRLWHILLVTSLLFNTYLLFYKNKDKANQKLASVAGQSFRWKDVSQNGQQSFKRLDYSYYFLLKEEAERWAENYVLPKEAQAKGITIEQLMKDEVAEKIQVTPEEAQKRYALSPAADKFPYPAVLKEIENDLRAQRYMEQKREYLKGLFSRHQVRFDIPPPPSYDGKPLPISTRFPVYEAPGAGPEVDAAPGVIRAPSQGPADAPITIEIYSDFHCPYSKVFSGTMKELQAQYPDKIRMIFHHLPLPIHPGSELTHQASVCAQEQGKFWEIHDKLMALKEKPDKDILVKIAGESGLNPASFQTCFDSGKHKTWVSQEIASGNLRGARGTPNYFINGRLLSGAMPVDQLKKIIDWHLDPKGAYPGPVNNPQVPGAAGKGQANAGLDRSKTYPFPESWLKKGPSRGPQNAPVTVVEFMDYNCPFCQKGNELTEQILAAYPDTVRVVPKNLPLPMHPNAQKTAEAVMCANEQGKFWEFRKEIFGEFWGKNTPEDMRAIAIKLKMDMSRFSECFDGSKMKASIEEDIKVVQALGGTGTPTFFVNGTPVVGAQPFENLKKIIDEKLAAKQVAA